MARKLPKKKKNDRKYPKISKRNVMTNKWLKITQKLKKSRKTKMPAKQPKITRKNDRNISKNW